MENMNDETSKEQVESAIIVTTQTVQKRTALQTAEYLIAYVLGALEILLGFRLVLKLLGANPSSGFVNFIYGLSGIFIVPFEGIFRRGYSEGVETTSVLEPSTVVAMIVYAVLVLGIIKLLRILFSDQDPV